MPSFTRLAIWCAACFFLAALAFPAAGPAWAKAPESFNGTVVKVIDGDSLLIKRGKKVLKVRLHQVDCPELPQPFGKKAKAETTKLVLGRMVRVEDPQRDPYYKGRLRAAVILTDGRDLGMELVRLGLAWEYRRYSENPLITDLEKEARQARIGLWADPNPQAPWEWRKKFYTKKPR